MARKIWIVVLLVALVGVGGLLLRVQAQEEAKEKPTEAQEQESEQPKAPPTAKDVILRFTQGVGKKLVGAAEGFPEELYEYKPNEEVRTFGEILLHIARSNDLIASNLAQRAPSDVKQFGYRTKAEAIATLKQSFATVVEAIEKNPDPKGLQTWLYVIVHGSEHYGNLVTYYRLNGLVPPASR